MYHLAQFKRSWDQDKKKDELCYPPMTMNVHAIINHQYKKSVRISEVPESIDKSLTRDPIFQFISVTLFELLDFLPDTFVPCHFS